MEKMTKQLTGFNLLHRTDLKLLFFYWKWGYKIKHYNALICRPLFAKGGFPFTGNNHLLYKPIYSNSFTFTLALFTTPLQRVFYSSYACFASSNSFAMMWRTHLIKLLLSPPPKKIKEDPYAPVWEKKNLESTSFPR